ncbi:hypothetical protein Lal_00020257 [Lupinus albus]|nr:hypothetical protein Lal_00020257 [Lupinus albus]
MIQGSRGIEKALLNHLGVKRNVTSHTSIEFIIQLFEHIAALSYQVATPLFWINSQEEGHLDLKVLL